MDLKSNPSVAVHRGATVEEIRLVLRGLKVKFPRSYVEFLKQVGWVEINGDPVFGLGPDADKAVSVELRNIDASVLAVPQVAPWYIVLADDGMGNFECLDTTKIVGDECPIVFWDHENPKGSLQKPRLVTRTFTKWLADKVEESPGI